MDSLNEEMSEDGSGTRYGMLNAGSGGCVLSVINDAGPPPGSAFFGSAEGIVDAMLCQVGSGADATVVGRRAGAAFERVCAVVL